MKTIFICFWFRITEIIFKRSFNFIIRRDFIYRFTSVYRREQELLKVLHGFTSSVIKARRQELLKNEATEDHVNDSGVKRKLALMDLLLQATIDGQPLNDIDIREEIDTFMFAGHDTTTSAMSFCLLNIAKHPKIQQRVFEEIQSINGESGEEALTLKDLNNLNYLEMVIKETLRLYPSAPVFARTLPEEITIGDYTFPQNCNVYISPFIMGRDATIFPDPLEFKPERFDFETTNEKINPYAYIPFSAGKN